VPDMAPMVRIAVPLEEYDYHAHVGLECLRGNTECEVVKPDAAVAVSDSECGRTWVDVATLLHLLPRITMADSKG